MQAINNRKKIDALMTKGDFKAAASLLQKKCKTEPYNAELQYLLGICFGRIKRWPDAINALQKSIAQRANIAQLHFSLGVAQLELKQFETAIESFQKTLKLDNNIAAAHIYLAKTFLVIEKISLSQQHYKHAINLNPRLAEPYYGLGCIEHEAGHSHKAIEFFEKALKLQVDSVDTLRMLASVFEKEGETEKAISYYAKALKINPDSVQAASGLALMYEFRGEIKEAVKLIDPLISKHPNSPPLGVAFAKLCSHINRCDDAIKYIDKTLLAPEHCNKRIQKNLHFTAASVLNDMQKYNEAFKHFKAGNEAASTHLYDSTAHMKMIDNIIATYTAELFIKSPRSTIDDNRPVFIIGMPRSGTSLTEQILAAHPKVYAAGELDILDKIIKQMPTKHDEIKTPLEGTRFFAREDLNQMASKYLKYLDKLSSVASIITDKMPHNFYHLGTIQLLFPNAHIIHISRTPLDNCLSIYFQSFSHGHVYANNLYNIGTHYRQYQRLMSHWKQVINIPLLEINYEDLVNNQETISRKILAFCNLDWDENCLQFHKINRHILTSSYNQVRQPLYNKAIGRWKYYEQYIGKLKEGLQNDY